ncbi:MAG: sugar nucleotide-binding protein [Candidatus Marinimicrobia bacterium]|jgi:dTDP-4-dehydrorhamnose reductase|nr:sugar nucleotide-binding protein [Candidatus Neomarinimicrobiota bacterium]MDP6789189.1 sugar nucleotide-binding protein [Candidatus Neomarinimicrobiota bacterium]MDP7071285.1 sugar nucleotide-binding protein [Candidatus Neomarinimicrobiota bacterium]
MAIDSKHVILTGGSGLLGKEIQKRLPDILAPSHDEFDIENFEAMDAWISKNDVSALIHAAAYTSPPKAEQEPMKAMSANIIGTANVVRVCHKHDLRVVYLSTDYVFKGDTGNYSEGDNLNPQNLYAWSKLGGECAVKMYEKSLIVRTSFCEPVFPYEKAFADQYTSRDSVDVIASMILDVALNETISGVIHVGTERKTVKELAVKLGKTDVEDLLRDEVSFNVPYDTSLNLDKFNSVKNKESKS